MLLEVTVNGERLARAGVDAGVVSAFVTLMRIEAPTAEEPAVPSASLTVNGFVQGPSREPDDQTAVQWGDIVHALSAGDEITIRVLEDGPADPYQITPMLDPVEDGTAPEGEP